MNKDLKRGKVKIDRKIDLHGYSLEQAYKKFKSEVKNNYHKKKRCLLVITERVFVKNMKIKTFRHQNFSTVRSKTQFLIG